MSHPNNNVLINGNPLQRMSPSLTVESSAPIVARFSLIYLGVRTRNDLTALRNLVPLARRLNPGIKFFGYASLGGSVNFQAWTALVDQWLIDLPSIDGIFIDDFGDRYYNAAGKPWVTRAEQNAALDYCHQTHQLAAWVNNYDLGQLFAVLAANDPHAQYSEPIHLGTTAFTDYVLLEGYYTWSRDLPVDANTPPNFEGRAHRLGRLWLAHALQTPNLQFVLDVGASSLATYPQSDWDAVWTQAQAAGINFVALTAFDQRAPNAYFLTNQRGQLPADNAASSLNTETAASPENEGEAE